MLEAVNADLVFTISLKRSTQNRQLSTSCPADYPIFPHGECPLLGRAAIPSRAGGRLNLTLVVWKRVLLRIGSP